MSFKKTVSDRYLFSVPGSGVIATDTARLIVTGSAADQSHARIGIAGKAKLSVSLSTAPDHLMSDRHTAAAELKPVAVAPGSNQLSGCILKITVLPADTIGQDDRTCLFVFAEKIESVICIEISFTAYKLITFPGSYLARKTVSMFP